MFVPTIVLATFDGFLKIDDNLATSGEGAKGSGLKWTVRIARHASSPLSKSIYTYSRRRSASHYAHPTRESHGQTKLLKGGNSMTNKPFRILSLDGGGVRGVFQAVYLKHLAEKLQTPLWKNFDLIVGTSTGGLLALAIAMDVDPQKVVDFYHNYSKPIFKISSPKLATQVLMGKGSLQSPSLLRKALTELFNTETLQACKTKVLIPATKVNEFGHRMFGNFPRRDSAPDSKLRIVDVAMASAAAPIFFPSLTPVGENRTYVDGGLWANNPCLYAILESNRYLDIKMNKMRVLSIGNGFIPLGKVSDEYNKTSLLSKMGLIPEIMFAAQAAAALEFSEDLVRRKNIYRVDVQLQTWISLDDAAKALSVLPALAENKAANDKSIMQFFDV